MLCSIRRVHIHRLHIIVNSNLLKCTIKGFKDFFPNVENKRFPRRQKN